MIKKKIVKKDPNYKVGYIVMIVIIIFTVAVFLLPGILGGIVEAALCGLVFLVIELLVALRWRNDYLHNKERAQSIVLYEIVGESKELRSLLLKDEALDINKVSFIKDLKQYEVDPKTAKVEIKRSGFYGRKDFAAIRNKKYPYIACITDTEGQAHIFWFKRDIDAEVLENYIKRAKGITAFSEGGV